MFSLGYTHVDICIKLPSLDSFLVIAKYIPFVGIWNFMDFVNGWK